MSGLTVYLFVRSTGDRDAIGATECRLQALHALREELHRAGVRVTPMPGTADLDVEITNVFCARDRVADANRVLIIRLSTADERLDFVCSDGFDHVSAEHHAAQRIVLWLESLGRDLWSQPALPFNAAAGALS